MSYNVHNDPEKRRMDWQTPRDLFDFLDQDCNFNFVIDCAADRHNALCGLYFDKTANFLEQDLSDSDHWCWCNPPYLEGRSGAVKAEKILWMQKLMSVPKIVCLIPSAIGADWFQVIWDHADAICFLRKRLKFIDPELGERSSAQFDCCLAIRGFNGPYFNRLVEIGNTVFLRDPGDPKLRLFAPYNG